MQRADNLNKFKILNLYNLLPTITSLAPNLNEFKILNLYNMPKFLQKIKTPFINLNDV